MPKWLIILLVILGLFIVMGLLIYGYFFGFTAKQKYTKCAAFCEKTMLQSSNIPACKSKCEEQSGYSPISQEVKQKDNKTSTNENGSQYACEWSWPQKIINASTQKVVKSCPTQKPYCRYDKVMIDDFNAGCCETATKKSDGSISYTNCQNLSEL